MGQPMLKKTETNIVIAILALAVVAVWNVPLWAAANFTLNISPSSISFPDANPSQVLQIPASSTVAVSITQQGDNGQNWSVHLLANGDLLNSDGVSKIPISHITWTASQAGNSCSKGCTCVAGTMSSTVPQDVIQGRGNTPTGGFNCSANFLLGNQWDYNTGAYTQTITVVTSSP